MSKNKSGIPRLLELSGQKKGLLLVSSALAAIHALLTMIPYILIFYILKELLNGRIDETEIAPWLIWGFLAVILSGIAMYASAMASHIAAFNILYKLRLAITDKLGRLPMGYLGARSSGALKKIIADDVERIELFIAHSLPDTVRAVFLPFFILGYLFVMDYRLALISLLPLIALLVVFYTILGSRDGKTRAKKYHNSLEEMNAGIVEFVRAMPVMKIFGQTASAFARYSDTVKEYDHHMRGWTQLMAAPWGMIISFLSNALLPVLAFGLYLYFDGTLELPVFFLFLILGVGYIRPLFKLTTMTFEITMINRGVKRMDEILFEIEEQKSGQTPIPQDFSLEFHNARFSYVHGIDVIKDLCFSVPQGTITALVGPSGSGKSTAGQLIARFYDLKSGSITIGGVNIKAFPIHDLMANVGFVFQDNMMFHQSIHDNILMGMEKTQKEVIAAAKAARCHDFIMRLPNGYETRIGDKGVHLSGGEQQRIQLARVILKDAPILILDEATAFSDPENEHLIMTAISELIQNKTVIIIAHRLSSITAVDQIVLLDDGYLQAVGTHDELLKGSKLYLKMWHAHKRAREFEILKGQITGRFLKTAAE
ncbi:ABC transporter ATP-binding protein [Dethiosulfatarculus sandiegensis]|uniref:ABC transporter n=1 Tax=Dethiosulfatarculus sandiegensis TaxID=1429043 RepID=A0A0D2HMR8_9BACT|nr:ABC transporter ATP-binding protein [Dethiosulfatarculus sandiegensis]KIX11883.1 ABC transporter [Dethiosulfatarculus sandiegensis]